MFKNFSSMYAEVSSSYSSTRIQLQTSSILDQLYTSGPQLLHCRLDSTSNLVHK